MEAAAGGEQETTRGEESHRPHIDVMVAAQRGRERRAILGEGRRVDDDCVELFSGALACAEIVKGIAFDEGDVGLPIPLRVIARALERRRRRIDRDDSIGATGHVERERAVIGKAIEGATPG